MSNKTVNYKELIQDYLFDLTIQNMSKETISTRKSLLTTFFKNNEDINETNFKEKYQQYILKIKENVSEGYIYQLVISIKGFCKHHKLNWANEIKTPKVAKSLPKHLNQKEIKQLFNTIKIDPKDTEHKKKIKTQKLCILNLLYSTGLRVSECVSLKKTQINFDENLIRVRGKGNKDRIVIFNEETRILLKQIITDKEYVFPAIRGEGHITKRYVQKFIKECGEQAKINQKVTPHLLRHSFATQLLHNGCNLKGIQQLLGHNSLATTQIYTNVDLTDLKQMYSL